MSQAKVDARKEQKKNRKKIEAHEKRMAILRGVIALAIIALIGAWAGYSGYVRHQENKPHQSAEVDFNAVTDYMTNMTTAAASTEEAAPADAAAEETAESTEAAESEAADTVAEGTEAEAEGSGE